MEETLKFKTNSIICVCGPTGVGKTFLIRNILRDRMKLFEEPQPNFIMYCYSIWQDIYSEMKEQFGEHIIFHQGLPEEDMLKRMSILKPGLLLLLDDVLENIIDQKDILSLFLEKVHHLNLQLLYVIHNLYCSGKNRRTLSLQTQYFIFFPTRTDQLSFEIFSARLGRKNSRSFMDIYDDVKANNYKYFVVDSHPRSMSKIFVWTQIFSGENLIGYEL